MSVPFAAIRMENDRQRDVMWGARKKDGSGWCKGVRQEIGFIGTGSDHYEVSFEVVRLNRAK